MHIDFLRDKRTTFPAVESPDRVTSLRVWHCKYATLSPVAALRKLETLVIGSFPDSSLEMLSALHKLRYLKVVHLPRVTTLKPLEGLPHLETLSLATSPTWDSSGKTQTVDSLAPLTQLPALRHLELFGVVPADRSLAALDGCKALLSARFSKFPDSEVERFRSATGARDEFNRPAPFET